MKKASINRKTSETNIKLSLNLEGKSSSQIDTQIPFLDHMLSLLAKHGGLDLKLKARGDLKIDEHHTTEDIGICLGQAVKKALGNKKNINRFGHAYAPMDESLVLVCVDISGRPYLIYNMFLEDKRIDKFYIGLIEDFFKAFVNNAQITLHINMVYGQNIHHIIEACFKALGLALSEAAGKSPRKRGIPSTKGRI
jgi:imidazoleglycerol-phosphate dehydratase